MRSNYRRLGNYIREVKVKNTPIRTTNLMGVNIDKYFMPSVANIVGTDLSAYTVVRRNQFACNRMHVGRDYRLPIALSSTDDEFIVSPAYDVFEIIDKNVLLPEYLMMWFSRKEFDRNAWFFTDADVRGGLPWKSLCDMQLPVPDPDTQREIVKEYNIIVNRIKLNERLCARLEETSQAIYKQWFVDFESDTKVDLKNYVLLNPKLTLNKGRLSVYVEMNDLTTNSMGITGHVEREYNGGSKFQNGDTLLARITPCLENGKTAFVNVLHGNEVAAGSTEFIVMRAKESVSPYWVYCLARDEKFRAYAVSSMVGSSGRQRVHEKYLETYTVGQIDRHVMNDFHLKMTPIFNTINQKTIENNKLEAMKDVLLSKLATIQNPVYQE